MIEGFIKDGFKYLAREEYYTYLYKHYPKHKVTHIKLFDKDNALNGQAYLSNEEITKLFEELQL